MLAFACAFTMFAGAAFTDQADITVDSDVVDTLVALGVIEGYTDGSFRPDDTVTRAEMAKMIYTVRTGRSDASAYNDDATTFTDIGDHWARGYIKYCNSLGIIAGHSATRFAPDDTVTTQEAAKMLLVTLGYDAERAGLTGAGWGTKTNALADENGLLDDVINGTTQGLPRQYAAQLIYNAINANTVVYRDGEYTTYNAAGGKNPTIGVRYMSLDANAEGILVGVDADSRGTYTVTVVNAEGNNDQYTRVPSDYSELMGQYVHVLKKTTDNTVYGLYADADSSVIVSGVIGDIEKLSSLTDDSTSVKIDGTDYDLEKVTGYWFNAGKISNIDDVTDKSGFEAFNFTAIDKDDNEAIDTVVVHPVTIAKVTYVSATRIGVEGFSTFDLDDNTVYEGAERDDWVVVTEDKYTVEDGAVIEKAEVISGKVSSVRNTDEVRIDGTWYNNANSADVPSIGDDVDLVVYNGYYFSADGTSANIDVAVVTGVGNWNALTKTRQVELLFPDGSQEVVNASSYNKPFDGSNSDVTVTDILVTYEVDDDEYALTSAAQSGALDDTEYTHVSMTGDWSYDEDNGAVYDGSSKYYDINSDAVVFMKTTKANGDESYTVMTGDDLMARNDIKFNNGGRMLTDEDGYVAYLFASTTASVTSGDTLYAYITEVGTALNADEDEAVYFSIITADGKQTEVETDVNVSSVNSYQEGMVISYTMDGDVLVVDDTITMSEAKAIDDASSTRRVTFHDGDRKLINEDTVIITIDSSNADDISDVEWAGSNYLISAGDANADQQYANAIYAHTDGTIDVIIVDADTTDQSVLDPDGSYTE